MKRFLLALILLYQKGLSPFSPSRCRFYPSCSDYAFQVIQKRGALYGLFYTFRRLLRCHPFSEGGLDYPPLDPLVPRLASLTRDRGERGRTTTRITRSRSTLSGVKRIDSPQ